MKTTRREIMLGAILAPWLKAVTKSIEGREQKALPDTFDIVAESSEFVEWSEWNILPPHPIKTIRGITLDVDVSRETSILFGVGGKQSECIRLPQGRQQVTIPIEVGMSESFRMSFTQDAVILDIYADHEEKYCLPRKIEHRFHQSFGDWASENLWVRSRTAIGRLRTIGGSTTVIESLPDLKHSNPLA